MSNDPGRLEAALAPITADQEGRRAPRCVDGARSSIRAGLALALGLALLAAAPAGAVEEQNLSQGLTAEGAPLAMHGYDPVAYFTRGAATRGTAAIAHVHDGATYYFASEEHRDAFEKEPAKYAPAYGGYCAYGVSVGKKFDADPRYWKVQDGRLYLNLNADIAEAFRKDVRGAIQKADAQWAEIGSKPVSAL